MVAISMLDAQRCDGPLKSSAGSLLSERQRQAHMSLGRAVVFIKTHKTGSSTLCNICQRAGDWRNGRFMLPQTLIQSPLAHGVNLGWYEPFPGYEWRGKAAHQHDFICNHAVYNDSMATFVKEEQRFPFFFTVLREPISRTISAFDYFNITHEQLRKMPSVPRLATTSKRGALTARTSNGLQLYHTVAMLNSQAFDLGWYYHAGRAGSTSDDGDAEKIRSWIAYMDERLHLVLLLEHLDEGLVMLAEKLQLALPEVVRGRFKGGSPSNRSVDRHLLHAVNRVDEHLYSYFKQRFWQQWNATRTPRWRENKLAALRKLQARFDAMCASQETTSSGEGCPAAIRTDVKAYTAYLRRCKNKNAARPAQKIVRSVNQTH